MYKRLKETYKNKPELFFIHIPKNAGTSIEDFGKKHNLIWGRFYKFDVGCNKKSCCSRWHIPPKDFINDMGWNIYFKDKIPFAVVRNPYTRIVSEYLYSNKEPTIEGLNLFVESIINKKGYQNDCHLLPQSEYTQAPLIKENQIVWKQSRGEIEILRFENIDQDFKELLKKYNYHIDDTLPKHNTRAKKVTMDDLTPSSIRIINKFYDNDFVNFGYDKIISRESFTLDTHCTPNDFFDCEYSNKLSQEDIIQLKLGQKKMSRMLKEFDRICRKYNIRYFLVGGSLIGALAYKGWIPWDSDIDLEIHEDDYQKFKDVIQKELPKEMWFQNHETDKNYPKTGIIGKIRDLNSCYIEYTNNGGKSWHNGLQIDINLVNIINNKVSFTDSENNNHININDIFPLREVDFEDFKVFVMKNSEKYLTNKYGKDWIHVLPKEKRIAHEGKILANKTCDFHYTKYPHLY